MRYMRVAAAAADHQLPCQPQAKLGVAKDGLPLFRNILPPLLPRLGFVGSEVSSYNNVLTSGLQVRA